MDRRDFLSATAGSLATVVASSLVGSKAFANTEILKHDLVYDDEVIVAALKKVALAAAKCVSAGNACIQHCQEELIQGNKEMATCSLAVHQMVASCGSIAQLASYKAKVIAKFLDGCEEACSNCFKACAEHKAHFDHGMHKECKRCMEACDATLKVVKSARALLQA